ncbi:hypothetical protein BO71DRAFT_479479, partial [Aspergillus ellipticus CBS 707.79]
MPPPNTPRISANTNKRRRLNAASTLSKPFKSPLRRPPGTPTTATATITSTPTASSTITPTPPDLQQEQQEQEQEEPTAPHSHKLTPNRIPKSTPKPTPKHTTAPTPQKPLLTLQTNLTRLRAELETVTQAHRLETSSTDDELERLIAKWRCVSQRAAEEVFLGARE